MKIKIATAIGIMSVAVLAVVLSTTGTNTNEDTVRVAFFPNVNHVVPIVGMEKEFFSESLGKSVTINTTLFDSGPQAIESIFADSIDLAYVGPGPAINGFLKSDRDIKIISGASSGGASFVVHPDHKIMEPKDLVGKKIAAPQIANTQDVSLRHYLYKHGLQTAEFGGSVFVVNVSNPDIYTLFAKGDIAAAWVPEPWATILVQDIGGMRLFYEEELWPEKKFASVLLIGRTSFIEKHPDLVSDWLNAHKKTVEWINENPAETRTVFNDFVKKELGRSMSVSVVDESLSNIEVTSDPLKETVLTFAERADSLGYLGRDGYDLEGIFYDIDSNPQKQEVSQVHGKT